MKILYVAIPFFFLFGCTDNQALVKQLEAEVIQIHDEVMPKNIDINRLRRQLKDIAQDSTLSENIIVDLNKQIEELTTAEESMNDWMAAYKAPSKNDPFEASMELLNKEKVKITRVKELMLSSLENGKKLLAKLDSKVKSNEQ